MDSPEIPTLVTARLRLRGIRVSDYEDYADLYADPEVMRLIGGQTWDRGRAWRHMAFAVVAGRSRSAWCYPLVTRDVDRRKQ